MPVVFSPYIERIRSEVESDGTEPTGKEQTGDAGGVPRRRIALGALVAGVFAVLAVRRIRRESDPDNEGSGDDASEGDAPSTTPDDTSPTSGDPSPRTRLRRVGRGWIRR